jgi:hypothetical protein
MARKTTAHSMQRTPKNPATGTKKWYHLKLFPKFALISFLVVAVPVTLIAIYVSYQSKAFILKSIDQFISDVTASMETITQEQQMATESVLDSANQELSQLGEQSLLRMNKTLIELNRNLYADNIQTLTSESQAFLGDQLQLLNSEISQEIVTLIEEFVEESRIAMKALADTIRISELRVRGEKQFQDVLATHEQFVHLRFLDSLGLNTALATRDLAFYQESDPAFTAPEPYLSSAFSGEAQIIDGLTKDGIPLLRVFLPVNKRGEAVGVVFGVASFLPLWNRIQMRFFNHAEQI